MENFFSARRHRRPLGLGMAGTGWGWQGLVGDGRDWLGMSRGLENIGSWRGEAPHKLQEGGSGGRAKPPPQEMQGGSGGDAVPPVRSFRYRFGSVFVSVRSVLH